MPLRDPCARILLAAFGGFFLLALLAVPVTTSTSELRQDPGSRLVFRTTYPKNSTMFLLSYLAAKSGPRSGEVHVRSTQWLGTMAVIVALGIFDGFVFCRLLRRPRRWTGEPGLSEDGEDAGPRPRSSGLSLFP